MQLAEVIYVMATGHDVAYKIHQPTKAEWRIYKSVNYSVIGSVNGLSPTRYQFIIWTNDDTVFIRPSETNVREILIRI